VQWPKREAVWRLQTDEDEIDLFRVEDESVMAPIPQGPDDTALDPEAYDRVGSGLEALLFTERAGIVVREHNVDGLAREHNRLTQAARKAQQYRERGNRYRAPVVMLQKAPGETNPRYAVVHSIPQYENPSSIWTPAMAQQNAIQNLKVSIARYIWRDQVPGVRGSPIRLTPLNSHPDDGALAWSFVGNHRQENGAVTHIYRFDASALAILNPGFETAGGGGADVFADWWETASDGTIVRSTGANQFHLGAAGCELTSGPLADGSVRVHQDFVVTPATNYVLSFWTRGDGSNPGNYSIFDLTGSAWIVGPVVSTGVPGTSWQIVQVPFTTPAGCISLRVHFRGPTVNGGIAYFDEASFSFSVNLVGTEHDLFDADPEAGDIYYIGFPATEPGFHLAGRLVTAGIYSGLVWILEYSDGAAGWPDFTLGSHYTRFPDDEMWNQLGPVLLSWSGYNDVNAWAAEAVNGVSRLWVRMRVTALTSMTTSPRIASDHMALRRAELEIPATSLRGRTAPYMMMRVKTPSGGDGTPGKIGNISRIIVGAKTENLTTFRNRINLGNAGNPAAIVVTYGTDTSAVASTRHPGGALAQCTFATDTTMTMRCRVTLTDLLEAFKGEYRVFLRCGQVGGVAGDDYVKLRAALISSTTYFPIQDFPEVRLASLAAAGNLDELVNLTPGGYLTLPFSEVDEADPSYATANLVLEVHAKGTAASDLFPFELILIPTNEWSTEYADPLANPTNGSSALRGDSILEDDGGVIRDRTIKRLISEGVELGTDFWTRRGLPPRLEPGKQTRLYFLFGFFPVTGFGQVPLLAQPGMGALVELYAHACYHFLRGDD